MAVGTGRLPQPGSGGTLTPTLGQMMALVEAQFHSLFHAYSRGSKIGAAITGVMSVLWYGMVALGAVAAGMFCSRASDTEELRGILGAGAMFVVLYWQLVPLLVVSTGAGLDLRRLVVYPLSRAQLFALDLILRFTTGVEALMFIAGASAGLWMNPQIGWWATLAFVPFVLFNLVLASALRGVFGGWMTSRRTRELAVLGLVALVTLPQILLTNRAVRGLGWGDGWPGMKWAPWALLAEWATGTATVAGALAMIGWTAGAGAFAWWQMGRTLRLDPDDGGTAAPANATVDSGAKWPAWLVAVFGDPVAALIEKEVRSLVRSPRFRVVFMMGFSFSLLIWIPMMRGARGGPPDSFLTLMMGYALLLLGDICFWNSLGFDRAAAQFYFLSPVPVISVLRAKNAVAAIAVMLELLAITAVAIALRMPVTPTRFAEAAAATVVTTLLLLAAGNLGSIYAPRPTDPSDVWRKASAGKTQALAMLAAPVLAAPVMLAYLARYAFNSEWAFWGTMAAMAVVASVVYAVALGSAAEAGVARRESITALLSTGSGPVAG